jgi:type I restriction enzyme S subunit
MIELPSQAEQSEIVRRVEVLFVCADRPEARFVAARAQVEKLTPSLLAKAFRGELVSQDHNDEPASVLLDRIRAQRDGQSSIKIAEIRKQSKETSC